MDLSSKLVQLGFTKNQAAVYFALIELGQCKAGDIIKKTGLHRNIVYEALDELVLKHLAFKTTKGGVALFQLSDANTLINDAESQLNAAREVATEINHLRQKATYEIKLYEGIGGLQSHRQKVFSELEQETDPKKKELLVLGAGNALGEKYYTSVFKKNDEQRAKRGISARLLFPQQTAEYAQEVSNAPLTSVKLLPHSMKDPNAIDIWKDQVAIMLYDIEPFIINIRNQHLADSFRNYFESLWNQETTVITGLENIKALRYKKLRALEKGDQFSVMWGNYEPETKEEMLTFFKEFHKERIQQGVHFQYLGFEKDRADLHKEMAYGGDEQLALSELRFLYNDNDSPMQIEIYPDSVTMYYWAKGEKAVAVDIQRQDIRDAMKLYFDSLWNQDTHIITGRKNVEQLIHRSLEEMQPGDTHYAYGGQYGEKNPEYFFEFWKGFHAKRKQKQTAVQLIGFEKNRKKLIEEVLDDKKNIYKAELRFLDQELLTPTLTMIFPKKTLTIFWDYDEAMAIETTRKSARNILLKHFNSLWKIAKK